MDKNLIKKNKDLNHLLKENIIKKSKSFGNNYNDTIPSLHIENMDITNDIYFLNIEKIIFSIGKNEENKSLNGIDIHYRNILTNKKFICVNKINGVTVNEENNNQIKEKYEFCVDPNDYIVSFNIIYGRYYIIRSIKLKTKNGIVFNLPEFTIRKSIKPDIYMALDEINPDINNYNIVNIFYGRGNIIHNIGCEYICENYYKKILRVKNFMNIKAIKKLYRNQTLNEVNGIIKENLNNKSDLNISYDEGNFF